MMMMQDLDPLHPVRALLGDVYVAFRVLFVAAMTPVSAMLVANAKGVQVSSSYICMYVRMYVYV
jgi:hypothetical protein